MRYVFEPSLLPAVPIAGGDFMFPVRRIHCVGRNYAEHAREMGSDPAREPPFFFQKPADAIVPSGRSVSYPRCTSNLHHEVELVVAIGLPGRELTSDSALKIVFGYAVGNDLTRRDLQAAARDKGKPWDTAKGFDASAPISDIRIVRDIGHPQSGAIWLNVNGQPRQRSDISKMTWHVPELLAELSRFYDLLPGDLVFTGTPEGVGPLVAGDLVEAGIDGVGTLAHRIEATS